jgi:hypothetical protein
MIQGIANWQSPGFVCVTVKIKKKSENLDLARL